MEKSDFPKSVKCVDGPWRGKSLFRETPGDTAVFTVNGERGAYSDKGVWKKYPCFQRGTRDAVVVYHGPTCLDGLTAGGIAYNALGERAVFVKGIYQEDPILPDLEGKDLYLLDFAYPEGTMRALASVARSVVIIDHHVTAEPAIREVAKLPNVTTIFDTKLSGSYQAWQYFNPDARVPFLVDVVNDHDIWKFVYPQTKPIVAALYANELSVGEMGNLLRLPNAVFAARYLEEGESILKYRKKEVKDLIQSSTRFITLPTGRDGGVYLPVVNAPASYSSDVGNELAKNWPAVLIYFDSKKHRNFSLRSSKEHPNALHCGDLAALFGGGGHQHAAGFKVERSHYLAGV